MREVNKFCIATFCITLILVAISYVNSKGSVHADILENPSKIFNSDVPIIDNQYIVANSPISKNFFISSIANSSYTLSITSNTSYIKTGDTITAFSKLSSQHVGDFTIAVKGDIDGNGEINSNDVAMLYQHYRNRTQLNRAAQIAGDVTNNGSIDLGDIAKIYQYTKGTIGGLN